MRIHRVDEQTVAVSRLSLLCCELLRQIPLCAESDDPAAQERLFSSPTGGREREFEKDWQQYVQPDLREAFRTALEIVRGDLKNFPSNATEGDYTVPIPVQHLEAWIHTLNQARLALAASHALTDHEMESMIPTNGDGRALTLFQVHFYGWLIECFLHEAEA